MSIAASVSAISDIIAVSGEIVFVARVFRIPNAGMAKRSVFVRNVRCFAKIMRRSRNLVFWME